MSCKLGDKCDNIFACNILRPNVELLGCNFYKPKKPMTNEEWICNLSTEEKAKFICNLMKGDDLYLGVMSARDMIKDELNHGKDGSFVIYEWLKEKHNE